MSALDDLVDVLFRVGDSPTTIAVGQITAVTTGAAADGNPLVTVKWQGATVRAAYLASYTPVNGHVVLLARTGPQLVVLGRLIGTPPTT